MSTKWVVLTALLAGACRPEAAPRPEPAPVEPPETSQAEIDAVLVGAGSVTLEENEDVVTVAPMVYEDGGSFLIADSKEGQVRRYGADGRLEHVIGRPGEGPGEFENPIVARRLADGRVVVGELTGGTITVFSPDGQSVVDTQQPDIHLLYGLLPLGDERLLIAGRGLAEARAELLHIWNLRDERIETSFFPAPIRESEAGVALSAGAVALDRRGDSLFVAYTLRDTVWIFDSSTRTPRRIGAVPIPFDSIGPPPPAEVDRMISAADRNAFMSGARLLFWAFAVKDGVVGLVAQPLANGETRYHWVAFDYQGTRRWMLRNAPRIVHVRGDTLFYIPPRALTEAQWNRGLLP